MKAPKLDYAKLAISLIISFAAAALGSVFTMSSIPTWYATLNKPWFTPPNWLFGPVWTTLFILMAISLYLVWAKGLKSKKVREALMVYGAQIILNIVWSALFFGLKAPLLGFIEIIALWVAIAVTIWKFYPIDRRAAYLLVPYICWVTIASLLNYYVWLLNV